MLYIVSKIKESSNDVRIEAKTKKLCIFEANWTENNAKFKIVNLNSQWFLII